MNTLSNKALLVVLNISQWSGRKYDKTATNTVENAYATNGKVGQFNKKLLPNSHELDDINNIAQKIRAFCYKNTLPWFSDGSRIISANHYIEFTNEYRKLKNEFDSAVNNFVTHYSNLVALAQQKLGQLFNPVEYPDYKSIASYFSCTLNFMPVPDVNDFRVEITEEEKQEFTNKMNEVETKAMNEVWNRLYEVVNKARAKLNSPDAKFRDSLIENIQEMCQLLPKLNLTNDQKLETMRQEVEKVVSTISPDACRSNELARQDSAKQLQETLDKMSSFMGKSA